jgi:hypothetical protein
MKLTRTLSSLCVACLLAPMLGAGPATQPGAPAGETEQLRQRIAQLEAEVADLRARLERASRPDAAKSAFTLTDELKIDAVPRVRESPPSGAIHVSGTVQFSRDERALIKSGSTSTTLLKLDAAPKPQQP